MKSITSFSALCALASTALAATPVVTVSGNAFFAGGERFFVRGIDYQPGGSSDAVDPIADATTCQRDITYFKQLGINTIRVYTVDNSANHDTCMNALAAAGIYLALDVNTGAYSINRDNPAPSYNAVYLQSVFATIDAFASYNNTLLFFSGNEVINNDTNSNCAPYVKAVGRDMKNYIAARGYRHIPVGYSAADVQENRYQTAVYMNCGPDAMARGDFFAFNDYSWCDPSSFTTSGWNTKVQTYMNYSIPIFLSEFGCITNPPRNFGEVAALYNAEMTQVYSGGLVYEYSEESSNPGYGVVNIAGASSASPKQPEFGNLASMYSANPAPTSAAYQASLSPFASCPTPDSAWNVAPYTGFGLPAFPSGAQQYMTKGAGTGPGLTGPGSQNDGAASVAIVTQTASGLGYTSSTASPASSSSSGGVNARPFELGLGPVISMGAFALCALAGATLL